MCNLLSGGINVKVRFVWLFKDFVFSSPVHYVINKGANDSSVIVSAVSFLLCALCRCGVWQAMTLQDTLGDLTGFGKRKRTFPRSSRLPL